MVSGLEYRSDANYLLLNIYSEYLGINLLKSTGYVMHQQV